MDKNTQQPVARIKTVGGYPDDSRHELELLVKHCHLFDGQLLYTAPTVPRDVLMAALNEANSKTLEICGACFSDEYIAAIADRYASQVQPEPVNQQLLAALKLGKNSLLAFNLIPGQSNAWEEHDEANLVAINAAIAAAEAAQPVVCEACGGTGIDVSFGDADDSDTVEFPCHACVQQPASAHPVAVPECPYPCGWQQLHKLAVEDGAYLARSIDEDEPVTANARATTMRVVGNLIAVTRAMLSAAPKPEGV